MFHSLLHIIAFASLATGVWSHWSYKGKEGIHQWTGQCATGRQQSPIDVANYLIKGITRMEPLVFKDYDVPPEVETMTNNGHSVTFTIEPAEHMDYPKIYGGGLPDEFQFSQFHFHWGSDDVKGSEHTINGYRSPMEMHLVHFNTKYGKTIGQAMANSNNAWDTLAVLGVMFQVDEEDNHNFDHIVEELQFVRYLDQEVSNVTVFPLMKVLPINTEVFYRYNGSLTTPPCSEVVIWTIFKEPVKISENQLNVFREVVDVTPDAEDLESESDNFRALQPLNERKLLEVYTGEAGHSASPRLMTSVTMVGFYILFTRFTSGCTL